MENICDWKNCNKSGNFKAPIEKDNSKKYRWLCAYHIKTFNKEWDYFDGMSESEIQNFIKSDMTWHRPTQKFSSSDNFFNIVWNNVLDDNFKIFSKYKKLNSKNHKKISQKDKEALKIMNLSPDSSWITIQKKFKILVKKFHPDMNLGSKIYENKLKTITLAYSHLKIMMKANK